MKVSFPRIELGSRSCGFSNRGLWKGEAEADFTTLSSSAGLAAGALFRSFVSAQAAHFLKDAFHFETGLETLEGAINRFAFADLNFGHKSF